MAQKQIMQFFLGANTPAGFRSYFSDACPLDDGWNIYVIKGGPGSGKSTLMRRIAQEAADRDTGCELIYCSSDPDSLDGVMLTDMHTAIFDGTAPHVIEPQYPGACEHIVNIGDAWSKSRLRAQRSEIIALSAACSAHHAQAVRFLNCADSFRKNTELAVSNALDRRRISSAAARLAAKYCGKTGRSVGQSHLRLISAVTPKGIFTFSASVETQCEHIIPVADRWYAPSAELMNELRRLILENGHDIIECRCSQCPEHIEHIIVPALGTAFTTCSDAHAEITATERAVHTERFIPASVISENKQRFAFNRKSSAYFTELAAEEMRRAKSVHDRLEQCYISAMNFDAVNELADKVCKEFFCI